MIAIAIPRKEFGTRAEARNKEVERCLRMNPDYILWLDSDQTMPDTSVEELIKLDADIAVIDTPPHDSEAVNITYNPDGTVAHCTMACSLIKREVFEKLPSPWFSSSFNFIKGEPKGGKYTYERLDKYSDDNQGEDIYFIRNAIEAGLTIKFVDGLRCNHYKL